MPKNVYSAPIVPKGRPTIRIPVNPLSLRRLLQRGLESALRAVDPAVTLPQHLQLTKETLRVGPYRYPFRSIRRLIVIGAGKASARMAHALEGLLGKRIDEGLIIVKYGHAVPTRWIRLVEAGHPLPDAAGLKATKALLRLMRGLSKDDLILFLLSGGMSSLLVAPVEGVPLRDKRRTTRLLLRCGATIQEINTVRKHVSRVKGGRLAAATPARVVNLIVSDVLGNRAEDIGSGPTVPDTGTFRDALKIVRRYRLGSLVPSSVKRHLQRGARGKIPDTLKAGHPAFRRVNNVFLANNTMAISALARSVQEAGIHPYILTTELTGEAREAAKWFGAMAREIVRYQRPVRAPCCLIAGGELTVTVGGTGKGGRAQEFALAAACEIIDLPRVWILAFGTDGTDGPTSVAGAVVDRHTAQRAKQCGLDPVQYLARNDSFTLLRRVGCHIVSGPTGMNVNDIYLLLVL